MAAIKKRTNQRLRIAIAGLARWARRWPASWSSRVLLPSFELAYILNRRIAKKRVADRCPRLLGTFVKVPEVQYHHDVYNQYLWNFF
jgi:hypothetical protein